MNTIPAGTTVHVAQEQGGTFVFLSAVDRDSFAAKERAGGAIEVATAAYITRESHDDLDAVADEAVEFANITLGEN